jgi:hypothetical protein
VIVASKSAKDVAKMQKELTEAQEALKKLQNNPAPPPAGNHHDG